MDTVVKMLYRGIGPIVLVAGLVVALSMQTSINRANSAVQTNLESTYALSNIDPGKSEEIFYRASDIRGIIFNTSDIGTVIEIHDYTDLKHARFTKTESGYRIEYASRGGLGETIPYSTVLTDSESLPAEEINNVLLLTAVLDGNRYSAEYEYSRENGRTNIKFKREQV